MAVGIVYWTRDTMISAIQISQLRPSEGGGPVKEKNRCEGKYKEKWYPCVLVQIIQGTSP